MNECLKNIEWFNLANTLIGVIVGGALTLFVSIFVSKRQSRREAGLKRIEDIYKPLYEELIKRNEYAKLRPYCESLTNLSRPVSLSCRQVWTEIKGDVRRIDVPKKVANAMDGLYDAISTYSSSYEVFCNNIRTSVQDILENETGTRPGDSVAMCIAKVVLNSVVKNDAVSTISRMSEEIFIPEDKRLQIQERLFSHISSSSEFEEMEQKRNHWVNLENKAIRLLKCRIRKAKQA